MSVVDRQHKDVFNRLTLGHEVVIDALVLNGDLALLSGADRHGLERAEFGVELRFVSDTAEQAPPALASFEVELLCSKWLEFFPLVVLQL